CALPIWAQPADQPAHGLDPALVPHGARDMVALRPPAIAVHDDRDVARAMRCFPFQFTGRDGREGSAGTVRDLAAPARSPSPEGEGRIHWVRISFSLCWAAASTSAMKRSRSEEHTSELQSR